MEVEGGSLNAPSRKNFITVLFTTVDKCDQICPLIVLNSVPNSDNLIVSVKSLQVSFHRELAQTVSIKGNYKYIKML